MVFSRDLTSFWKRLQAWYCCCLVVLDMLSHDFSSSKNPTESAVQGIRKWQLLGFKWHMVLSSLCTPSLDSKPLVLRPPDTQRILAKKSATPGKTIQCCKCLTCLHWCRFTFFLSKIKVSCGTRNCQFLQTLKTGVGKKPKLLSYKLLLHQP